MAGDDEILEEAELHVLVVDEEEALDLGVQRFLSGFLSIREQGAIIRPSWVAQPKFSLRCRIQQQPKLERAALACGPAYNTKTANVDERATGRICIYI